MNRVHSSAEGGASIPGELVARLEVAEAGSRELDRLVGEATGHLLTDGFWRYAANVTTSVDRALALAERVLPTFTATLTIYRTNGGEFKPHALASLMCPYGEITEYRGDAATPALALCAAVLRAKQ